MSTALHTKEQKIAFLQDLAAGRATIDQLRQPYKVTFWDKGADPGTWSSSTTGEALTAHQLATRIEEKGGQSIKGSLVWIEVYKTA